MGLGSWEMVVKGSYQMPVSAFHLKSLMDKNPVWFQGVIDGLCYKAHTVSILSGFVGIYLQTFICERGNIFA